MWCKINVNGENPVAEMPLLLAAKQMLGRLTIQMLQTHLVKQHKGTVNL